MGKTDSLDQVMNKEEKAKNMKTKVLSVFSYQFLQDVSLMYDYVQLLGWTQF